MPVKLKIDSKAIDNINAFNRSDLMVKIGVVGKGAEKQVTQKKGEPAPRIKMAALAAVHEFGSPTRNIPARSFLRKTMNTKINDYKAFIAAKEAENTATIARRGPLPFLLEVGNMWKTWVRDCWIFEGPGWRKLRPSTLARKTTQKILWDQGNLHEAIEYEVKT